MYLICTISFYFLGVRLSLYLYHHQYNNTNNNNFDLYSTFQHMQRHLQNKILNMLFIMFDNLVRTFLSLFSNKVRDLFMICPSLLNASGHSVINSLCDLMFELKTFLIHKQILVHGHQNPCVPGSRFQVPGLSDSADPHHHV